MNRGLEPAPVKLVLDGEPLRLLLAGLANNEPLRGSDRLRWNGLQQLVQATADAGDKVAAPELALLELARRPAALTQLRARLASRSVREVLTIVRATRPVIYRAGRLLGGVGKTTASVVDAIVVATAREHFNPATIVTIDPGDLGLLATPPGVTVRAL